MNDAPGRTLALAGIALFGAGILVSTVAGFVVLFRLRGREGIPGPSRAVETRAAQGATTEDTPLVSEGGATPRSDVDRPNRRREGISSRPLRRPGTEAVARKVLVVGGVVGAIGLALFAWSATR